MIPEFDENGNLPEGIHPATLDEIDARFGRETETRKAQMQSIRWLIELVGRDDVRRIILNGSFVTDVAEPNDVDCALFVGPDFGRRGVSAKEWNEGLPFIHFDIVDQVVLDDYVNRIFAFGRGRQAKGMIEVIR